MFSMVFLTISLCLNALEKPNIILIMADDLGYGDVAFTGNPKVKTPVLDKMAETQVRFDWFYAAAPVCTPTRVSCLTGRHPSRVNMSWAFKGALPKEEITLAEILRDNGYRTGHFGKWHLGQLSKTVKQTYSPNPVSAKLYSPPWENGFDTSFSVENSVPSFNPYYLTCGEFGSKDYLMVMDKAVKKGQRTGGFVWRDRFWEGPGKIHDEWLEGALPEILINQSLKFINKSVKDKKPFLSLIWFSTPHSPVVAGPKHRALYKDLSMGEQHWYGSITAMDEQIGVLKEELKNLGVSDNTIIWFCSDNGPSWVHELNSAGPFKGKKGSLSEGGIRVPSVLEWPAKFKKPISISEVVTTSDFYPTLLKWAGITINHNLIIDGEDVSKVISGKSKRTKAVGFQAPVMKSNAKDTKAWNKIGGRQMVWLKNGLKLISIDDGSTFELYDLKKDKEEKVNIAADNPEILKTMKSELIAWLQSCKDSADGKEYK